MKRKYISIIFLFVLLIIGILFAEKSYDVIKQLLVDKPNKITVVIDAGHGGFDPGKVGINKALEKDINLSVAYKLKILLEQNDINVIMTRKDKYGLYKDSDMDKKRADMKRRISIINSSDALLTVSIHQNSFQQESSWGAQVFYYAKSEEGRLLAETIQETIKSSMNDGNRRLAKSNNNYYLLLKTNCPTVIVECGFLSNRREADLLCNDSYQDKMSRAIYLGIMKYINNYGKSNSTPLVNHNT